MRKKLAVFFMVLSFMVAGASANAALMTYEYAGNPFPHYFDGQNYIYTTVPGLTGTLTLDNAITSDSTVNSDGSVTFGASSIVSMTLTSTLPSLSLSLLDAILYAPKFSTDPDGKVISWDLYFRIEQNGGIVADIYSRPGVEYAEKANADGTWTYVISYGNPGTWTLVTPTNPTAAPEPTTMLLFGMGLMGLTGLRRKLQR